MSVYPIITNLLKEQGMSKLQLAMKAGINPSDLYAVLNGKREMFPKWRKNIAGALGIPEDVLTDEQQK